MEYNVENLFDTLHTAGKADMEFTPLGEKHWNSHRYWKKLGQLSKVIAAAGGITPVDLIALVEIENDSIASNLVRRTKLWRLGYEYIITHSPDTRGINVALLYQPHRFRPILSDSLRIAPTHQSLKPSRDVLHVCGEITTGDTLDVFICHLPSRKGGKKAERYRNTISDHIRTYADSLMRVRQTANIVITGDMNSFYPEKNFTEHLKVRLPQAPIQEHELYLLSHDMQAAADIRGTYKYQKEWNQLDHFIVSGNLLKSSTASSSHLSTTPANCLIGDFKFLLARDRNSENVHPNRTYLGNFYNYGISDHLPLILDFHY